MTPDPRPLKRYRATKAEWNDIRDAFVDERCWVCDGVWTELHHILNRSHSGDDVVVNLAPLCMECHSRVEMRDPVARALLRGALMPSNYAYLRYRLGEGLEGWLVRNYSVLSPKFSTAVLALEQASKEFSTLSTPPTIR